MTDEDLSRLSLEEKMSTVRYLIADLAANLLSDEPQVAQKARHDLGGLAMTFKNMYDLITAAPADNLTVVRSIYKRYRYQSDESKQG